MPMTSCRRPASLSIHHTCSGRRARWKSPRRPPTRCAARQMNRWGNEMSWLDTFRSGHARRRNLIATGSAAALAIPAIEFDDEQRYRPIDWQLVRRLLAELRPLRWQYALGIVVGMVHVLLDLSGPFFIAYLID